MSRRAPAPPEGLENKWRLTQGGGGRREQRVAPARLIKRERERESGVPHFLRGTSASLLRFPPARLFAPRAFCSPPTNCFSSYLRAERRGRTWGSLFLFCRWSAVTGEFLFFVVCVSVGGLDLGSLFGGFSLEGCSLLCLSLFWIIEASIVEVNLFSVYFLSILSNHYKKDFLN